MKTSQKLVCAGLLVALLFGLTGCGKDEHAASVGASHKATRSQAVESAESAQSNEMPNSQDDAVGTKDSAALTEEQRNSINMLNHLTMLTKEIGASTNSKLYLENAYSTLINNTYPNAVDKETLLLLRDILDILENFRMTEVKRERLAYVYEQNKAQALRSAIPNPLGLLSAVRSNRISSLIPSVVYMAVDSASSYKTAETQSDMQYLQDGWALDDENAGDLHDMRRDAFSYMVTMVNTNHLPGDLALNEESVSDFVAWKNESNVVRRIQLLEENRETYEAYGPYWLVLAESYYNVERYEDCLSAFAAYEDITTRIFRKDYELAKTLPVAIAAADHVYTDDAAYVEAVRHYLNTLLDNTAIDDWALRYFAAQTLIDLHRRTGDAAYLSEAYQLALNNVTHLTGEQQQLNIAYMDAVKKASAPKGASQAERTDIDRYNKLLEEERKTALPPVSNAFMLNCDLLFALADELDIAETEKARVDSILHHEAQRAFLCPALDDAYWFVNPYTEKATNDNAVSFTKERVTIPAYCATSGAKVRITIRDDNGTHEFSDFAVTKVERKEAGDIASFVACFESPTLKAHEMKAGAEIEIELLPYDSSRMEPMTWRYVAEETKTLWVFTGIAYRRVE